MTWKQTMAGKSKTSYVIGFHSSGNIHEYNFKTCQPQTKFQLHDRFENFER
jgi:hypothetical protein